MNANYFGHEIGAKKSTRLGGKYIIRLGYDGDAGSILAVAEDLCDALVEMERILGGREIALGLNLVNRGEGRFIYNFILSGRSAWLSCAPAGTYPHASAIKPLFGVEKHREGLVFI